MIEFFRGLKRFSVATIIVSAVMGVLFIAFPSKCIEYISLVIGLSFVATGIISVVSYIVKREQKPSLVLGCLSLVAGIVICVRYRAIISFIVVVLGIFILTSGLVDMAAAIRSIITFRIRLVYYASVGYHNNLRHSCHYKIGKPDGRYSSLYRCGAYRIRSS